MVINIQVMKHKFHTRVSYIKLKLYINIYYALTVITYIKMINVIINKYVVLYSMIVSHNIIRISMS